MLSAIYAIAITAILHSTCVDADEAVRYEQLAMLHEAKSITTAESYELDEWYEPVTYNDYSWEYEEPYYETTPNYYETPSDGLNSFTGVNYHDGRTETFYSSQVLYHYRTNEWWLDDEGFYRTDEGFYVVAASDMEQGTTFEGSKGTCIVLDCGCADGVTDYYVRW